MKDKQNYKHRNKITSCKFCKLNIDTVKHLLLECEPIQKIWKAFENSLIPMNINRRLSRDIMQLFWNWPAKEY